MVEHAVPEHDVEPDGVTVEQWLEFDGAGDLRVELIDGALVVSPAPAGPHQLVATGLLGLLFDALRSYDVTARATGMGVVSPEMRPEQGLIPDVLVARSLASMAEATVLAAADALLAVEVLSPSSRRMDRVRKMGIYAGMGVPHYWIVDPARPVAITAFSLEGSAYREQARAFGDELLTLEDPFPVSITPSRLLEG
jgi:Uma2 family endonuclease